LTLTIEKPSLSETFLPNFRREQAAVDLMKREMTKACVVSQRKPTHANEAKFDAVVTAFCAVQRERNKTVRLIVERGGLLLCV